MMAACRILGSHVGCVCFVAWPAGNECHHSCPIQAWSSATLLDALYDYFVKA